MDKMPYPQIHELIDIFIFGRKYSKVHNWIDSTSMGGKRGRIHWVNFHHLAAINKKYSISSFENKAARLHVLTDWIFYYQIILIPDNENEVINMLTKFGIYILDDILKEMRKLKVEMEDK